MRSFSYFYLVAVVPAFLLLPLGIALYRRLFTALPVRMLLYYLVVSGSINLVAVLLSRKNNLPLLHLYTIAETVLLLLFFCAINKGQRILTLNKIMLILFPLACIINFLFFQSLYRSNTYVRPVEALLLIFFSMEYYWREGQDETAGKWTDNPLNWIVAGILLYFSGSFFQFVFSNVISATANMSVKLLILNLHGTFVLIMYLFFAIGFLKWRK